MNLEGLGQISHCAAASMPSLLLNETGTSSTNLGTSSWPCQWKPDEEPGPQAWPPRERAALQEELSDVLIYLVALAARCRVDLPRAVLSKMDTNRRRYPVHLSRGSARKYTDLPHGATSENQAVGPADLACESTGQAST
ncbi:dCTP pyrophosphatase 1 isoform X2 [Orcinus orca]|uniref:dCTP pyrophosphatase 1 isoform X2 n=1 Tax=Orcinus orca TaxID=9733 RepID=UPI002111D13C|nr:dCTP pyrophosphatase 1 isoform X2 [Orcinus orca]